MSNRFDIGLQMTPLGDRGSEYSLRNASGGSMHPFNYDQEVDSIKRRIDVILQQLGAERSPERREVLLAELEMLREQLRFALQNQERARTESRARQIEKEDKEEARRLYELERMQERNRGGAPQPLERVAPGFLAAIMARWFGARGGGRTRAV